MNLDYLIRLLLFLAIDELDVIFSMTGPPYYEKKSGDTFVVILLLPNLRYTNIWRITVFLYAIRLPANDVLYNEIRHLLSRPVSRPPNDPIVMFYDFMYQAAS